MADVNLARGGTPDFKGYFCEGDWPQFNPPYSSPHYKWTPPFNSHACAAKNQGFLTLDFPLVPNLDDTRGHAWMQKALQGVTAVGDDIWTNWVPTRSFLTGIYYEVTEIDDRLTGLYLTPIAGRVRWDWNNNDWLWTSDTDFDDELTAAGVTPLPLGTPQAGDKTFGFARLSTDPTKRPSTFGIDLNRSFDPNVTPQGIIDSITNDPSYGHVILGFKVTAATSNDQVALLHRCNFAVYLSAKLVNFEASTQTG